MNPPFCANVTSPGSCFFVWLENVEVPFVEKNSLIYDIVVGFAFAGIFTTVTVLLGCTCYKSLECILCPSRSKTKRGKLRTRRRYRVEENSRFGLLGNLLMSKLNGLFYAKNDYDYVDTKYYDDNDKEGRKGLINSKTDSWDDESDDDDRDRLEYGEKGMHDDDVDYDMTSKEKGRYADGEIKAAAQIYFDEERVKKFFEESHHSDSDSDNSDTPLDLEMIEKKIIDSMKHDAGYI